MELQSRGFIETTDSYTMLIVEKVDRYDSGKYVVEAENPSGKKSATVLVKVYGRRTSKHCVGAALNLESNSTFAARFPQTLLVLQLL